MRTHWLTALYCCVALAACGMRHNASSTVTAPVLAPGIIAQTLEAYPEGESIRASVDARDESKAATVMEHNQLQETTTWDNPSSGAHISMTPTAVRQVAAYGSCKAYTLRIQSTAAQVLAHGVACKKGTHWLVIGTR